MAHKFVSAAKTFGIENIFAIQNDSVIQRSAPGQAHGLELFNIAGKSECAGKRQMLDEGARSQTKGIGLFADGGVVEIDTDPKVHGVALATGGRQACILVAIANLDRLEHANATARARLTRQARLEQQTAVKRRRSIHDGNFRAVDLNDQIVQADTCACSHKVLNGRDRYACVIGQRGPKLGCGDIQTARDNAVITICDIGPDKDNP